MCRIRVRLETSASTGMLAVNCRSSTSSRSISKSGVSPWSTRITRAGFARAIWRHSSAPRDLDDALARLARSGRDRDQQLVGTVVAENVGQLVGRSDDADAVDPEVLLARVVVDDPDRRVAELARPLHLPDHELARVPRADHDHLLAARNEARGRRALEDAPRGEARPGD